MNRKITRVFSLVLCMALLASCLCFGSSAALRKSDADLKFRSDGSFKIIQISDLQDGKYHTPLTMDYVCACVREEQPDLIVYTGDWKNSSLGGKENKATALREIKQGIACFMEPLEEIGIPVTFTFGNHDIDGNITPEEQMAVMESYSCFIGVDEGADLTGCGNYNLPIKSADGTRTAFNIWCFDSNYGGVVGDRLDWYRSEANALKAANGGESVPAVAFQHIIVEEASTAVKPETIVSGVQHESCCPATGAATSAEFTAMKEQGDVIAMFFGHDHVNTFTVPYQGIDLVNTPTSGFGAYGDKETRGLRVITLRENGTYSSRIVSYYDKFCVDEVSTARFIMCSGEYSVGERLSNAGKYIWFKFLERGLIGVGAALDEIFRTVS